MRWAWFLMLLAASVTSAADKPNVLLIVGDDWGWTDYGFMGHPDIKTPNLDKLAKEGALFPNGYTPTSLCRASLATILTGQYAHEHKICCNDPPAGTARDAEYPLIKGSAAIPRVLSSVGYSSFQTGKFWEGHFSNAGFTHGMTLKGRHGDEGLDIGRKSLKPIDDFVDANKGPWFIWYAPMLPHQPHNPPERILKNYQKPGRDARLAKYMAMCEWTDETVGNLLTALDKRGLRKNLLIMFVVDNGWVQATGPVKAGDQFATRSKNTPYDAGVRTPVIVHWPEKVKPGKYADLVSTIDIAPTIWAAADAKAPQATHGLNLMDVANGGKAKLPRDAVFGELYVHTSVRLEDPVANLTHRWVREGNWKLIVPVKDGSIELFDLDKDPNEKNNLAKTEPEVVARLQKRLADDWKTWPTKK